MGTGRLEGKVALVTGAARGQGEQEARLFASEGAAVVLTDVLDDEGKVTAADIGTSATYHHHDVTSEADWQSVVAAVLEEHGQVDVLINNAGIFAINPMVTTSEEEFRRICDVNQLGTFLGMKKVATPMIERGTGSIVNISSV